MKLVCTTAPHIARENYRAESSSGSRWPARLAGNPSFLLADEPTGNLDFRTGEMIISLSGRSASLSSVSPRSMSRTIFHSRDAAIAFCN